VAAIDHLNPARVRSNVRSLVQRVRARLFQRVVASWAKGEADLIRLGSDYGGWWVPRSLLRPGTTALCAGVGDDTTFDEALVSRGVDVWALDPTPRATTHVADRLAARPELASSLHFLEVGLWSDDATLRFYEPAHPTFVSHSILNLHQTTGYFEAPCWSLETTLRHIGQPTVDILKLDIEGAEQAVLRRLVGSSIRPTVILVELDLPLPARATIALLRSLRDAGYELVHAERWNLVLIRSVALPALRVAA
jgi:FkbM family methyltransferase